MLGKLSKWQRDKNEIALVKRNFDESFYLKEHPEITDGNQSAFEHFMSVGWKLGFDPAPWFSIADYLEAYPDIDAAGINPFRHFLVHGERENRKLPTKKLDGDSKTVDRSSLAPTLLEEVELVDASGYFNEKYYLETNADLKGADIDPLVHFCQYGWHEGRSPSQLFDLGFYYDNFPKTRDGSLNPVIEFLESGLEGSFIPNARGMMKSPAVKAPADADWDGLKGMVSSDADAIDIIVPVYRGYDETLRCLYTVLTARNEAKSNLVVIDDRSPEPELSERLEELAAQGLFTLLANEENLGFVRTVNRGMALHDDRDVVLLNSDTEVYDFWLDRMLDHAKADPGIATITPLSNNATICSYPITLTNNSYDVEQSGAELTETAYRVNKGQAVDVPTGVGFCFYIRRASLQQVGDFDEAAFAKGYGEENDFCVRVEQAGWRNILALDVYVRHHGEVSFAEGASKAQAKGLTALVSKHPGYLASVHNYIKRDPARAARARLDAARLSAAFDNIALFVAHNWGGGIDRNIDDLITELRDEGVEAIVMRSLGTKSEHVSFDAGKSLLVPNLENLHVNADADLIAEILAILSPRLVHVHSLIGFLPTARDAVMAMVRGAGVPYYFTFHDYAPICAHGQFVTPAGEYCGEPGPDGCRGCLKQYPPVNGWVDVAAYQAAYRDFILGANGVFAPSQDAADRANAYLGTHKCIASPHPEIMPVGNPSLPAGHTPVKIKRKAMRVAFAGAIGPHKGREIMEACARESDARNLPLYFRLVGYSDNGSGDVPHLTVTGKYKTDAECLALLQQYQPHFIAFFSIWPETYSYALSLAFRANIPPVVFDIGAMAERVKASGFGHVLPVEWMKDPRKINDFLLANPIAPLPKSKHRALVRTMENQAPQELLSSGFYNLESVGK
ncbi:MAG: glycosyltransferase [Alphaproteobacteria bacterium]|nr:MAG: glycosyltransferase [Alphaproteobacteria bacterium]